jgi:hypothetical protein
MTDFNDLYSRDFNGTFVGVMRGGILRPFHVEGVGSHTNSRDEDGVYLYGTLYLERANESVNVDVLGADIRLNHVDLGMIQVGNKVGYIKRVPRRQWRRGFRMNNCARPASFCSTYRTESNAFYRAVFNPTYKTLEVALAALRRANSAPSIGFALTQDFALVRNTDHCALPMIQYRDRLLGFIDNDNDLHLQAEMDTPVIRKMLSKIYTKGVFKHATLRNRR